MRSIHSSLRSPTVASAEGQSGSKAPGNGASELPGAGSKAIPGTDHSSAAGPNPPVSNSTAENDADIVGVDPESSTSVVTHNDDGSFTVDIYENDGLGNTTKVGSETFSDSDGDGTFEGDKGGSSAEKAPEGSYETQQDDEGVYIVVDDSSDDSDTDSDTGETDTESSDDTPTDDDEFTPDPDASNVSGLYNNAALMQSLYQFLSDEKSALGKGGKDSSPNPMNETMSGKKSPVDYKGMIARPVDGSSTTATGNIQEMKQQLQDPNAIQGGVIDPTKN